MEGQLQGYGSGDDGPAIPGDPLIVELLGSLGETGWKQKQDEQGCRGGYAWLIVSGW